MLTLLLLPVWHQSTSGSFVLEPARRAVVRSVVPGLLEDVFVKEGTVVEAGQPLAKLRNVPLQSDLAEAQAQFVVAADRMTLAVLGKDRDVRLDIAGGSQIPKTGAAAAESARILAELRKSWHGVERLLLAYDGSPLSADFLDTVMSFLDPAIAVTLIDVVEGESPEKGIDSTEEAKQVVELEKVRLSGLPPEAEL